MRSNYLDNCLILSLLFYPSVNAVASELVNNATIRYYGLDVSIFSMLLIALLISRVLRMLWTKVRINDFSANRIDICWIALYTFLVLRQISQYYTSSSPSSMFYMGDKYIVYVGFVVLSFIYIRAMASYIRTTFFVSRFCNVGVLVLALLLMIFQNQGNERMYLDRLDPNSVAMQCGLILICVMGSFIEGMGLRVTTYRSLQYCRLLTGIISVIVLLRSKSVGLAISLVISLITALGIVFFKESIKNNWLILMVSLCVVATPIQLGHRLSSLISHDNSSLHTRMSLYANLLRPSELLSALTIGNRVEFGEIASFHNSVLEIFYSGGLLSLVCVVVLIVLSVNNFLFNSLAECNTNSKWIIGTSFLFLLLNSFIGGIITTNQPLLVYLSLLTSIPLLVRKSIHS